eukprot:scpid87146/ scgid6570/ 
MAEEFDRHVFISASVSRGADASASSAVVACAGQLAVDGLHAGCCQRYVTTRKWPSNRLPIGLIAGPGSTSMAKLGLSRTTSMHTRFSLTADGENPLHVLDFS